MIVAPSSEQILKLYRNTIFFLQPTEEFFSSEGGLRDIYLGGLFDSTKNTEAVLPFY